MESSLSPSSPDRNKYDIIRARMDHEDELITSRLNWLIISQSFLFGAYASLFRSGGTQPATGPDVAHLVQIIPLVGICTGFLIYTAIIAGVIALMHNRCLLRNHLETIREKDPAFPQVQGYRPMVWLALMAPMFLPLVLMAVWCILLGENR
jgi:hypothetical protein